ncbi:MAG: hypothetical protein AVDCRST_MAG39-784, partial [uncultured Sphingomonadaceae bacterium]
EPSRRDRQHRRPHRHRGRRDDDCRQPGAARHRLGVRGVHRRLRCLDGAGLGDGAGEPGMGQRLPVSRQPGRHIPLAWARGEARRRGAPRDGAQRAVGGADAVLLVDPARLPDPRCLRYRDRPRVGCDARAGNWPRLLPPRARGRRGGRRREAPRAALGRGGRTRRGAARSPRRGGAGRPAGGRSGALADASAGSGVL